jgi:hypothetical protein
MKDTKLETIQHVAHAIAKHANQLAFDPDYMSPFSMHACSNGYNIKGTLASNIKAQLHLLIIKSVPFIVNNRIIVTLHMCVFRRRQARRCDCDTRARDARCVVTATVFITCSSPQLSSHS